VVPRPVRRAEAEVAHPVVEAENPEVEVAEVPRAEIPGAEAAEARRAEIRVEGSGAESREAVPCAPWPR